MRKLRFSISATAVIITLGILARLGLLLVVPEFPRPGFLPGYNDEPLHLYYVDYIADARCLPVFQPTGLDSVDHIRGETGQAPLYYILSAPLYSLLESIREGWGLYGARMMSLLFGIGAAWITYQAAWLLARRREPAFGALIVMALAPNAVVFSALVSNDSLLMLTAALFFHSLILCRTHNGDYLRQILTGVFLGLAIWTKLSAAVLLPVVWFAADPMNPLRERWLSRLRVTAAAAVVILPLVIWSLANYGYPWPGGGVGVQPEYSPEEALGVVGGALHHPWMAFKLLLRSASQPFQELWGDLLEKLVSLAWILGCGALTVVGAVLSLADKRSRGMLIAAMALFIIAFVARGSYTFQVEFRLFAPVFFPLAYFAGLGAERALLPGWQQALVWALPLLLMPLLALGGW